MLYVETHDGVAQWIERQFAELNVAGSTPVTVAFLFLVSIQVKNPCISVLTLVGRPLA